jgi:hypothetical protein
MSRAVSRLTASEKVRRDLQVVADRARGFRWATIAERHRISERHARAVWAATRASGPALGEADPVEILHEALLQLEALIEELALLAETADHDAVRLGCLKAGQK